MSVHFARPDSIGSAIVVQGSPYKLIVLSIIIMSPWRHENSRAIDLPLLHLGDTMLLPSRVLCSPHRIIHRMVMHCQS